MFDDSVYKRVKDAIKRRGEKPASERIAKMQARGVIDENGKILLRMLAAPKSACRADLSQSLKPGSGSNKPAQGKKKS